MIITIKEMQNYLKNPQIYLTLIIIATLINMFILRKAKDSKGLIFWSMFFLLSDSVLELIGKSLFISSLSVLCKFLAFVILFLCFTNHTHNKFKKLTDKAEKKLSSIDKSVEFEVKKRVFDIERSNQRLVSISKTDFLTKALNKAALIEKIDNLITTKSSEEFCVLMFDIDNFKQVNDLLGHIAGDKCLRKLSQIAKSDLRETDCLGRYGGDEFIIIAPKTSMAFGRIIAEKFRKKVDSSDSPHFTVSIGISAFPQDGLTSKELIAFADEGLYKSKKKGKNAVSHKSFF